MANREDPGITSVIPRCGRLRPVTLPGTPAHHLRTDRSVPGESSSEAACLSFRYRSTEGLERRSQRLFTAVGLTCVQLTREAGFPLSPYAPRNAGTN